MLLQYKLHIICSSEVYDVGTREGKGCTVDGTLAHFKRELEEQRVLKVLKVVAGGSVQVIHSSG